MENFNELYEGKHKFEEKVFAFPAYHDEIIKTKSISIVYQKLKVVIADMPVVLSVQSTPSMFSFNGKDNSIIDMPSVFDEIKEGSSHFEIKVGDLTYLLMI